MSGRKVKLVTITHTSDEEQPLEYLELYDLNKLIHRVNNPKFTDSQYKAIVDVHLDGHISLSTKSIAVKNFDMYIETGNLSIDKMTGKVSISE